MAEMRAFPLSNGGVHQRKRILQRNTATALSGNFTRFHFNAEKTATCISVMNVL